MIYAAQRKEGAVGYLSSFLSMWQLIRAPNYLGLVGG